MLETCH